MKKITKVYPNGTVANKNVDFDISLSEIHALAGGNGAGKTTLMRILFGLLNPDTGKILVNGKRTVIQSPADAMKHNIGMVHQHFTLIPSLTVAENVVLGIEPKKLMFFDKKLATSMVEKHAEKYKFNIDLNAKVSDISVSMKQKVEILKTLIRGSKILILDEPTAVLTIQEAEKLFEELLFLKKLGYAIVYITHRIPEIKQIADRMTVMRSGENKGVYNVPGLTKPQISRRIMGFENEFLECQKQNTRQKYNNVILEVKNLSFLENGKEKLINVNCKLFSGEILGVAGIEGNGQKEFLEILFGFKKRTKGYLYLDEAYIKDITPKKMRNNGVSYVPEDRMQSGIAENCTIAENLLLNSYPKSLLNFSFLLNKKQIYRYCEEIMQEYQIDGLPTHPIRSLSGGNIQKVVIAREFSQNPSILLLENPTRGVDIGTTNFIHKKIKAMASSNASILLVSSNLEELLQLSNRLIVFYKGKIVAVFSDLSYLDEKKIGEYMLGLEHQYNMGEER